MKTKISRFQNFKIRSILVILSLVQALFGCKEYFDYHDEIKIDSNESELGVFEYTEKHLATLGAYAALVSRKPNLRDDIYSKIEKRFDGDYNVLFNDIIELTNTTTNVRTGGNTLLEFELKLKTALDAFKDKEGVDYYPQIYIPFYEELKAKNKINTDMNDPIIILFLGDDSKSTFPGYKVNERSELVKIGFDVDEEYAQKNEVWVISINERYFGEEIDSFENGITNGRTNSTPSAKVDEMKCKCHHESWPAGASEVHIITVASDFNITPSTVNINLYGGGQYEGGEIYKFSRSQVSNNTNVDLDFNIWSHWNSSIPNSPYGHYVIFEYDAWPTGLRTASWSQGGGSANVQYRSADLFYDKQSVLNTNFATHVVNNSCMEWKGQYQ